MFVAWNVSPPLPLAYFPGERCLNSDVTVSKWNIISEFGFQFVQERYKFLIG